MKRSEMIYIINSQLNGNSQHPDHLKEGEIILNIIEKNGMLPPAYVNTDLGDHMNFYEINQWEEE